jgi:hypothetical protein
VLSCLSTCMAQVDALTFFLNRLIVLVYSFRYLGQKYNKQPLQRTLVHGLYYLTIAVLSSTLRHKKETLFTSWTEGIYIFFSINDWESLHATTQEQKWCTGADNDFVQRQALSSKQAWSSGLAHRTQADDSMVSAAIVLDNYILRVAIHKHQPSSIKMTLTVTVTLTIDYRCEDRRTVVALCG